MIPKGKVSLPLPILSFLCGMLWIGYFPLHVAAAGNWGIVGVILA